jgi:DNA invertase Pin-like site-specific DNA recombinase
VLNLGGETVDTKSATGKLIRTIFAGFAQFERGDDARAAARGDCQGESRESLSGAQAVSAAQNDAAVKLFKGRTVTQIAAALTVGRGSVYRALEAAGVRRG